MSFALFIVATCSNSEKDRAGYKGSNSENTEEDVSDFKRKNTYVNDSEESTNQVDTANQSIELVFEGKNLLIKNRTDETISIIESSTEIFVKINNEWQLFDKIRSALAVQSYIPGKAEVIYDFSRSILETESKEIKFVIYYQIAYDDYTQYAKEIVYVDKDIKR